MKNVQILLFLVILVIRVQAQLYTGPAEGTSATGVLVNTGSFIESAISNPDEKKVFNKFTYIEKPDFSQPEFKNTVEQIYIEDTFGKNVLVDSTVKPLVLKGFNGIVETNSIPPDPYIAVGPSHILSQVNTSFAISDKNGNRLKTIDATSWYQSVLSVAGPFDPKVVYDQYSNRWVMVWLDQDNAAQRGNLLISVSDDENPLGAWYNWSVPSSVNGGTAAGNWSDYQGVGYDQNAIYITSNQFNFSGSFEYSKVRIIPKTQLYKNTGEAFKFFDLWDIRNPLNSGSRVFSIRPSRSNSNSSDYYMVHLPQGSSNAAYIYQLNNVTTAPVMTGYAVGIKSYSSISTANQLGGGSPALEAGNASLRNEPVHKDDKLHFVHSVNNPLFSGYAALHYVQVNLSTKKVIEDVIYGANKFFYIYPALAVDKNNNVALTYSRSGDEEYAGAFFTAKMANTTNFVPSVTMQAGRANYVKTFSGTRNRWGDYNGMWLDPSNEMSIWAFSEFTSATNTWGTWTTELRLEAYTGMHLVHFSNGLHFKPTELGYTGDTVAVIISNYGSQAVQIDSIGTVSKNFLLVSSKQLPLTLNSYDSLTISVIHKPIIAGLLNDSLKVYANDPSFGSLPITAKGYIIVSAFEKKMYGIGSGGKLMGIDKVTGTGAVIGSSNFESVIGLALHPKTKVLYGLRNDAAGQGELLRFNAETGEAFSYAILPNKNFTAIAFDTLANLYAATRGGLIYSYDLQTGVAQYIDSCKTILSSMAFNPRTNQLWGSAYKVIGSGKDRIFKINLLTGDTTLVGATGFSIVNNAIVFDEKGLLYGIKGATTATGDFIKIDTATGTGTLIGSTGIIGVTALGYFSADISPVERNAANIPAEFGLAQNYPNPFNPETMISYNLAGAALVTINIYNVLGEKIVQLESVYKSAGTYTVKFDTRKSGNISSGIYFYEMIAEHAAGMYRETKKMNILK